MMNAEENLDIDLDLDDHAKFAGTSLPSRIESAELESVSPPTPVTPMYSRNLLQTNDIIDGGSSENTDEDKINEAGCLSSDSSQSGNSVVASPFLLQKHASGLFGNDQSEDFSIEAPNTNIIPSEVTSDEVHMLASNFESTSIKSNDATSTSTTSLFSNDNLTDDFLKTPGANSPLPSQTKGYGLRTRSGQGSNYASPSPITNTPTTCGSYDNNKDNDWKTHIHANTPNFSSPVSGSTAPLQSATSSVSTPNAGPAVSDFASGREPGSCRNVNETHCSPVSEDTAPYIHNYSNTTEQRAHSSLNNLTNEKNVLKQYNTGNTPLLYNPSNLSQSPVYPGNLQNENPIFGDNLHNASLRTGGNLQNTNPVYGGDLQNTSPIIGGNLQNTNPVYGGNLQNTSPIIRGNLENTNTVYGGNLQNTTPVYGGNLQNTTGGNLQNTTPVLGGNLHNTTIGGNLQNTTHVYGGNLQNTRNEMYKSNDYLQVTSSISSVTNRETTNTPKNDDSPLFIPQMYCNTAHATPSTYFVPEQVNNSSCMMPQTFHPPPAHVNNDISPPTYEESMYPHGNRFDISPLGYDAEHHPEKGIFEWLKDHVTKDWPAGAHNLKKYMKNATDSVLTTLDPGMRDYLSPGLHIGVASQSIATLIGIKEGFTDALHAVPIVQGHSINNPSTVLLPIGFDSALQTTYNNLEYLTNVKFGFPGEYILIASQVFLTELVSGKWYVMYCLGLKDNAKNIALHSFSQPIPLPIGCINASYNGMVQNETGECIGYNITIDEVVGRHIPYERDWCSQLAGKSLHQIIAAAVQCLALDYQRHVTNIAPRSETSSENAHFHNAATNKYTQCHSQYSVSLDAFG